MDTSPFAQALDEYLSRTGESESEFARQIGVKPSTVNRWRDPTAPTTPRAEPAFAAACRRIGKTLDDLYPAVVGTEPAPVKSSDEAA